MRKHLVRIGVAAIVPLIIGGVLALLWGGRLVPSALAAIEGPTLTGPASRSTVSSYSPTLTWTNPPGAAHYQVQVIPPPQVWYVMLPDMGYGWRVRMTDQSGPVNESNPVWGPFPG